MNAPIYLDYAATTPVDPRVAERMVQFLTPDGVFGNPASRTHALGWQAESAVEGARRQLAQLVNCDPREIVWTSGATEADNLALKGAAMANQGRGQHIVTSLIEHKAVIDCCKWLEQRGFEVTWLTPMADGRVSLQAVEQALRDDTLMVSLMAVNNELGVINDIAAIGTMLRQRGILFHVDAAQALGKIPLDLKEMPVDMMAFSGHKLYAPKGMGALYVRRSPDVTLEAQIHGGGHERGLRSGTLATHQIVGLGEACAILSDSLHQEQATLQQLRERFLAPVMAEPGVHLHGAGAPSVPGIANLGFEGVDGESLMLALRGLAVSSGSACASASLEPSFVLKGIGVSDVLAQGSLRFSFGRFTTPEQVDQAAQQLVKALQHLRQRSAQRRSTV